MNTVVRLRSFEPGRGDLEWQIAVIAATAITGTSTVGRRESARAIGLFGLVLD